MNQIASAEATTDLIEKIKKFDKLKKVKDIYKNTDAMFDAINKNLTNSVSKEQSSSTNSVCKRESCKIRILS